MHCFYKQFHNQTAPPSSEEIETVAGHKKLSLYQAATDVADLKKKTATIFEAFQQQVAHTNCLTNIN
ncbi:hypothetical protein C0995_011240 [Termitomyces sp. Mi166|nr:hypothetical protein C0995_011240 [Termitomyces sp. Mi166\